MNYGYQDYTWGDLLTDVDGDHIEYDAIGNPVKIGHYDKSSDEWSDGYELTWNGRQLISYQYFEYYGEDDYYYGTTIEYTYNADGIRTSKTVDGIRHDYVLTGSQIISEIWKSGNTEHLLYYVYDENGLPIGLKYRTSAYEAGVFDCFFFEKNLQGDIIGVYNSTGKRIGTYTYDAWGNFNYSFASGNTALETRIVFRLNPFRYRGYYYDVETGLYYLQSRYYNPEWGRFLNADNQLSTGDLNGANLFAYCGNNPVNRIDPTGEAWWHWAIGATIVVGCAALTVATCGGFAAAAGAVCAVASGVAAATTASTVAAAALIGSATVYGIAVIAAAATSNSVEEFNEQGNWETVAATAGGAILGGAGGYVMSKAQEPRPMAGRGTQNPKVKAAIQKGQAMHKQMDYGPGVLKEQTIAPGCRVDGIDFNNRIIYELKPNNPQAIARGINQLNRYTSAAKQQFGGTWTGVLKLYD